MAAKHRHQLPLGRDVVFFKGATRRYRSVVRRSDGVDVALEGGAYNRIGGRVGEVPHDIAHLIVEDELRLDRGVWGVLIAGGLFRGASVLAGRRRPHATARARELLKASEEQLKQAEILTRAVCDLSLTGTSDPRVLRAATGARWWSDTADEEALVRGFDRLRTAAEQWAQLAAGQELTVALRRGR